MRMIPAIDLRAGQVVRLSQGDYARQTDYAEDPLALALAYEAAGAIDLHVVDLDGARSGEAHHLDLISTMANTLRIPLQTGGGVRHLDDIAMRLDRGAARVVVGSLCVRDPDGFELALQRFGPEALVAGLDVLAEQDHAGELQWRPRAAGWTEAGPLTLWALLDRLCATGLSQVLCTDIQCDGLLGGASLALYRALRQRYPRLQIQASGGIGDEADLHAVAATGADACIVGRALLEGRITRDRIQAWSPSV